jgi:hypothetical protein
MGLVPSQQLLIHAAQPRRGSGRGDTRLADIYLGEFMRLLTHFCFRGKTKTKNHEPAPGPDNMPAGKKTLYLTPDDSWARRSFVKSSAREKERLLFRAPPAA